MAEEPSPFGWYSTGILVPTHHPEFGEPPPCGHWEAPRSLLEPPW